MRGAPGDLTANTSVFQTHFMTTNTDVSLPFTPTSHTASEPVSDGVAVIASRRPWLWAAFWSLIPVVLTSIGFGAAQSQHLDDRHTYLWVAAAVTVAAVLGLVRMARATPTLTAFGFRRPTNGSTAGLLGFAPLVLGPVLVALTTGVGVDRARIPGFLWLAAAAAVSEEVWYRGLVMAVLRQCSLRTAIVGSAAIFGVLHLANLFGGVSPVYAVLQLAFAALFGLVAALVVTHTRSLWPVIAWHFAHDAVTYVGGDVITPTALGVLPLECVVLTAYAIVLWRRLPKA